jgi:hypothetical protein
MDKYASAAIGKEVTAMCINICKALLIMALAPAVLGAQQSRNMSGAWQLDVDGSVWGNASKPLYVVLNIVHREPLLEYSGSVAYANDETRQLEFDGRIDGREYAMQRSFGAGQVVIWRSSASTVRSVFKTDDGKYTETATTSISRDGNRLTRKIHVTSPKGNTDWTEVYRRD